MAIAKPWLVWPLLFAFAICLIWLSAAVYKYRKDKSPKVLQASGFTGIVRDSAKFSLLASFVGWIGSIMATSLDPFPSVRHLLLSALITSLMAAIINYFLSAAVDAKKTADGKGVNITSVLLPALHGAVFGLSLSAMALITGTIIYFSFVIA